MRKRTGCIALLAALLGAAGAQSAAAGESDALASYRSVLDQYYTGLTDQWSMQDYADAGLCYLSAYYANPSLVGYRLEDVDNNGVEELLIGEMETSVEYQGMFFEMYTLIGGSPVRIASSTERSRYYLCNDGSVAYEGSSGAAYSVNAYYSVDADQAVLSLLEAVIYDGEYDAGAPWFYSKTGTTQENYTPISEGDAQEIMAAYQNQYESIAFTSFSEYEG